MLGGSKRRKRRLEAPSRIVIRPIYNNDDKGEQEENDNHGEMTTLDLPTTLGRRNLALCWWKNCPNQCRADKLENRPCSSFCACLRVKAHMSRLSKSMVNINKRGNVTITARYPFLVHYDEPGRKNAFRPKIAIGQKAVITIGGFVPPRSQERNVAMRREISERSDDQQGIPPKHVWMRFEIRGLAAKVVTIPETPSQRRMQEEGWCQAPPSRRNAASRSGITLSPDDDDDDDDFLKHHHSGSRNKHPLDDCFDDPIRRLKRRRIMHSPSRKSLFSPTQEEQQSQSQEEILKATSRSSPRATKMTHSLLEPINEDGNKNESQHNHEDKHSKQDESQGSRCTQSSRSQQPVAQKVMLSQPTTTLQWPSLAGLHEKVIRKPPSMMAEREDASLCSGSPMFHATQAENFECHRPKESQSGIRKSGKGNRNSLFTDKRVATATTTNATSQIVVAHAVTPHHPRRNHIDSAEVVVNPKRALFTSTESQRNQEDKDNDSHEVLEGPRQTKEVSRMSQPDDDRKEAHYEEKEDLSSSRRPHRRRFVRPSLNKRRAEEDEHNNVDDTGTTAALRLDGEGLQEAPPSAQVEEAALTFSSKMLSMPQCNDADETASGSSLSSAGMFQSVHETQRQTQLLHLVAAKGSQTASHEESQRKPSGPVFCRDLSLHDWRRVQMESRRGSFRHAMSEVILAKNDATKQEAQDDAASDVENRIPVWLPAVMEVDCQLEHESDERSTAS